MFEGDQGPGPGPGRALGRGRGRCGCGGGGGMGGGFGGGRSDSLVFPSLLLSLQQSPCHGYELMEKLERMSFVAALPDPAVVYRYLRRLEEEGMVESRLEPGQGGPARKVYSLTVEGESYLQAWVIRLRKQKNDLETFLKTAGETAGEPGRDETIGEQTPGAQHAGDDR